MIPHCISRLHAALNDSVFLEVADSVANKTTIASGGVVMYGGFTMNEYAVLIGIVLGVAGFVADIWFKHKRLKLLERERRRGRRIEDRDIGE